MNQPHEYSFDPRSLRDALGTFATGVTVVTARGPGGQPVGVTVNSFAAVSLEPPLVLWSLGMQSPSRTVFETCSHYVVNVLAADQVELSQRFSQSQSDRFGGIALKVGAGGTPILPGCCAWFECRNEFRYPGGDHVILVGHVENLHREDKPPLIFHGGNYRFLP
ncbi:MAG: flavin reductase family protein [Burkholderiaceae bacterium]|nr:flavin reductase family protein [Sulfuritalea sp.]MCF8173772.1 flavin reductase family protein [Burkholderiaceae bacterium]MCF8184086.1 flavin reductase family protein [Polynucleobacter sp.]